MYAKFVNIATLVLTFLPLYIIAHTRATPRNRVRYWLTDTTTCLSKNKKEKETNEKRNKEK